MAAKRLTRGPSRVRVLWHSGELTSYYLGCGCFIFGLFFVPSLPVSFCLLTAQYSNLPADDVHSFVVKNLLKGAPSILGSLLYVCAESFRCFQSADSGQQEAHHSPLKQEKSPGNRS